MLLGRTFILSKRRVIKSCRWNSLYFCSGKFFDETIFEFYFYMKEKKNPHETEYWWNIHLIQCSISSFSFTDYGNRESNILFRICINITMPYVQIYIKILVSTFIANTKVLYGWIRPFIPLPFSHLNKIKEIFWFEVPREEWHWIEPSVPNYTNKIIGWIQLNWISIIFGYPVSFYEYLIEALERGLNKYREATNK